MDGDRKAKLDAAAIFYGMFRDSLYSGSLRMSQEDCALIEKNLLAARDKAQQELDGFRAAMAAKAALHALLPGCVEIDFSDHLPKALWRSFMSNDRAEWIEWLAKNTTVPREEIEEYVQEDFRRQLES